MPNPLGINDFGKKNLSNGFVIEHIGRNFYKIYVEAPNFITLSGSADVFDVLIPLLFRITHIEMNSDDATAKDLIIYLLHPNYNSLDNPTRIFDEAADVSIDIFKTYGEGVEFEGGSTLRISIDGTVSKLFNLLIYIQVLK